MTTEREKLELIKLQILGTLADEDPELVPLAKKVQIEMKDFAEALVLSQSDDSRKAAALIGIGLAIIDLEHLDKLIQSE